MLEQRQAKADHARFSKYKAPLDVKTEHLLTFKEKESELGYTKKRVLNPNSNYPKQVLACRSCPYTTDRTYNMKKHLVTHLNY